MQTRTLGAYLAEHAGGSASGEAVAALIEALAGAAVEMSATVALGALGAGFAETRMQRGAGGDEQKGLDVVADGIFLNAARRAPVALYASEELGQPVLVDRAAQLALAIDPLDGSSNIDTNLTIGTIFSVLPAVAAADEPLRSFLQPGGSQLAAGFFVYGPQLALVLSLGRGTSIFLFSPRAGDFLEIHRDVEIARKTREFAINMSNYRHWDTGIRAYVDECLKGVEGAHARDYNMRWLASAVAEAYRIVMRGGVYLYPADARKGYGKGRLRLVYEAAPIAMLVEQAGGAASTGTGRVLDQIPTSLHQHTPLIFGSAAEVACVLGYLAEPHGLANSPLFAQRGLFRS